MKLGYLIIPALLFLSTGCGTMERMNHLVNQSTEAIHCNRMAVEKSTETIRKNAGHIDGSNRALKENHEALQNM